VKACRPQAPRRIVQVLCLALAAGLCAMVSASEPGPAGGDAGPLSEARAGTYDIRWQAIAGGAGQASGGDFQLRGSVGQHSASADHPAAGAGFSHAGGFWVVLAARAQALLDRVFRDRFE